MKEMTPKVSIIMGIYNCEKTLEQAIESILNQTYTNWELIMCDDCSTDNTYKVAKKYEKKYPDKIRVIKNNNNITLAPTLNKCLKLATGEYIARQDGDDFSHKKRLEREVEFLEKNKKYDLVGTNMISFDENGEKGVHKLRSNPNMKDLIKNGPIFAHATIMMKTSVMKSLNGYCEEWYAKQAEDYELWFRFLLNGYKGYNLNENLYYVREDIETFKRKNIRRRLRGIALNFKIYLKIKAPIYAYKNIIKDIIAIFIPRTIFIRYYKWKLNK